MANSIFKSCDTCKHVPSSGYQCQPFKDKLCYNPRTAWDSSEVRLKMGVMWDSGKEAEDKHYDYTYKDIKLDPYRILKVYNITDPAQQHSIKKLLRAGKSVKSLKQDIEEVQLTLTRWLDMLSEDVSLFSQ